MKSIAQRWWYDCLTKQSLAVVLVLLLGILSVRPQGSLDFSVDLAEPNTDYPSEAVLALTDQLLVTPQGTLEFSADLTAENVVQAGQGIFVLTDQLLTYTVSTPFGFSLGEIRGPGPSPDAPIVFQLGYEQASVRLDRAYCTVPGPGGIGGGCIFRDAEMITESQAAELVSGQWYVWAHSPTAPSFPISGEIVPEPTVTALLVLGLLASTLRLFRILPKEVHRYGNSSRCRPLRATTCKPGRLGFSKH